MWGNVCARATPPATSRLFDLHANIKDVVRIKSLELLQVAQDHVVRATATSGAVGYAVTNQHAGYLPAMFNQRVVPAFLGKDARDLEDLIDAASKAFGQ